MSEGLATSHLALTQCYQVEVGAETLAHGQASNNCHSLHGELGKCPIPVRCIVRFRFAIMFASATDAPSTSAGTVVAGHGVNVNQPKGS